jgi:hypothetical protein
MLQVVVRNCAVGRGVESFEGQDEGHEGVSQVGVVAGERHRGTQVTGRVRKGNKRKQSEMKRG